ncbi:MAG: D-alanine--D-alanine ligase [Candidatus Paceibacterota bacterium]
MSPQLITVGVLRGGPSSEHDVSLRSGETMLRELGKRFEVRDLLVDTYGQWIRNGVPTRPEKALRHVDVVVNGMHGEYGEDGKVQRLLDSMGVPYTGSNAFASALAINKSKARQHLSKRNIKQPVHRDIRKTELCQELVDELFETFPQPSVVKPRSLGSSVGVSIVRTRDDLRNALDHVFTFCENALIEEYIKGKEATCGVIDGYRNERMYALPIVEIRPSDRDFFDYEAKYGGSTHEICPGNFTEKERKEMQQIARDAHTHLGLRHYSRSDFIVTPRRGVYLLEVNTLPGMTPESLFPKSLAAVGSSLEEFLTYLVGLAHSGARR